MIRPTAYRPARRAGSTGAFTLTELLVVIGIVILVAAVTVPTVLPFMKRQTIRAAARTTQAMVFHARGTAIGERALAGLRLYVLGDVDAEWPAGTLLVCYDSGRDDGPDLHTQAGGVANLPAGTHFSVVDDSGSDLTANDLTGQVTSRVVEGGQIYSCLLSHKPDTNQNKPGDDVNCPYWRYYWRNEGPGTGTAWNAGTARYFGPALDIRYEANGLVRTGDFDTGLNVRVQDATGDTATVTVPGYMGR